MNDDTADASPPSPKPKIILDVNEDKRELGVGVDIDGDGKVDFTKKIPIKDARFWAAIGWILLAVSVAKDYFNW